MGECDHHYHHRRLDHHDVTLPPEHHYTYHDHYTFRHHWTVKDDTRPTIMTTECHHLHHIPPCHTTTLHDVIYKTRTTTPTTNCVMTNRTKDRKTTCKVQSQDPPYVPDVPHPAAPEVKHALRTYSTRYKATSHVRTQCHNITPPS